RLVVGDDQRRPADLLDRPRHRRRLARPGRSYERREALAGEEAGRERIDRLRLVAGRAVVGGRAQVGHGHRVSVRDSPPHAAYARITAAFCGGLAGAGALARALDHDPHEHTALELVTLALATSKAARRIARDPATIFIREPLVEEEPRAGSS